MKRRCFFFCRKMKEFNRNTSKDAMRSRRCGECVQAACSSPLQICYIINETAIIPPDCIFFQGKQPNEAQNALRD